MGTLEELPFQIRVLVKVVLLADTPTLPMRLPAKSKPPILLCLAAAFATELSSDVLLLDLELVPEILIFKLKLHNTLCLAFGFRRELGDHRPEVVVRKQQLLDEIHCLY